MSSSYLSCSTQRSLRKISALLTKCNRKQRIDFCVENELPISMIDATVDGVGKLNFPLSEAIVEMLTASKEAILSKDGKATNKMVGNIEINADKLNVKFEEKYFNQVLAEIRQKLGFPNTILLNPQLQNMLICGPNNSLEEHRDNEMEDGTIAKLIIIFPTFHLGGDLIISHNKEKHIVISEDMDLDIAKCVASYIDCHHEEKKVKRGNRIALSYNLISSTNNTYHACHTNLELEKLIKKYFDEADLTEKDVQKFTYFLDYYYAERDLKWNMLKGTDVENGSAIYNIAHKLNLVPHLVLVEIERKYNENITEINLCSKFNQSNENEKINITSWIGPHNEKLPYDKYPLSSESICCVTETAKFKPHFKELKCDNTTSVKYQRAAIVLWSLSKNNTMKFILNYTHEKTALFEMLQTLSKREISVNIMLEIGEYLYKADSFEREDFFTVANFAVKINDSKVALELLSYCTWNFLDLEVGECLTKFKNAYTMTFVNRLLNAWENERRYKRYLVQFLNICKVVTNLLRWDVGSEPVQFVLEKEYAYIMDCNIPRGDHMDKLQELLKACELAKAYCSSNVPNLFLIDIRFYSMDTIVKLAADLGNMKLFNQTPWCINFYHDVISKVTKAKFSQYRAENDWSIIPYPSWCKCRDCSKLKHFLLSRHKVKQTWSFPNGDMHNHFDGTVHYSRIQFVTHTLYPFGITLEKPDTLHFYSKFEFDKYDTYLSYLQTNKSN